jgi:hypothetical protein
MDVVESLCRELEVPLPPHCGHEHDLVLGVQLGGETFSLVHRASPSPECVLLYCHLAMPLHDSPEQALLRLLHLNHELGPDRNACFCIDANTGEALYSSCIAIGEELAARLLCAMNAAAALAAGWRESLLAAATHPGDAMAFGMAGRA